MLDYIILLIQIDTGNLRSIFIYDIHLLYVYFSYHQRSLAHHPSFSDDHLHLFYCLRLLGLLFLPIKVLEYLSWRSRDLWICCVAQVLLRFGHHRRRISY